VAPEAPITDQPTKSISIRPGNAPIRSALDPPSPVLSLGTTDCPQSVSAAEHQRHRSRLTDPIAQRSNPPPTPGFCPALNSRPWTLDSTFAEPTTPPAHTPLAVWLTPPPRCYRQLTPCTIIRRNRPEDDLSFCHFGNPKIVKSITKCKFVDRVSYGLGFAPKLRSAPKFGKLHLYFGAARRSSIHRAWRPSKTLDFLRFGPGRVAQFSALGQSAHFWSNSHAKLTLDFPRAVQAAQGV
jgi:hypothetical protein